MKDEWYIIETQIGGSYYIEDFGTGVYLCDQMDGLISCINYLSDKYEQFTITRGNNDYSYNREDHYKNYPNI